MPALLYDVISSLTGFHLVTLTYMTLNVLNSHFTFLTMIILHILLTNGFAFICHTPCCLIKCLSSEVNVVQWMQAYCFNAHYY